MLRKIFNTIENTELTLAGWIFGFLGIVVIRTFLENFSGRTPGALLTSDLYTIVHYTLFYLGTLLLLVLILHHCTGKAVESVGRVLLFGFMIVLTPPVIDFVLTGGKGIPMMYLIGTQEELWKYFFTFFTANSLPGITAGIRIEFVVVLMMVFTYAISAGKSLGQAVLTTLLTYGALFFCIALPSFLPVERSFGFLLGIDASLIGSHFYRPDVAFTSFTRMYEMYFNAALSQVWYLIVCVLSLYILYLIQPQKWVAIFRNSRPERVAHYSLMICLGAFIAYRLGLVTLTDISFFDVTTLLSLWIAFYFAWMFAVGTNDIVDCQADSLSNPDRPLVTGVLTVPDVKLANSLFLSAALLGGLVAGHAVLFLVLVFTAVYYIYSCPPLHLKRFPLINSFCIALATLSAVLAGFYTISNDLSLSAFPTGILVLVIVAYTCLANVKDLKDIEGDTKAGVYTLPVIFKGACGKLVVWGLLCLGLFAIPFILQEKIFWVPTLIACGISYRLIHRQPFQEKYLFRLYFLYAVTLLLLVLLS